MDVETYGKKVPQKEKLELINAFDMEPLLQQARVNLNEPDFELAVLQVRR